MDRESADFDDMDPAAAAQYAKGGPEGLAESRGESSNPGGESYVQKLFDGNARGPPLRELESEYDLSKPLALFLRGLVRLSDSDGVPPIGEMAAGSLLWVKQNSPDRSDESGSDDEILAGSP